VACIPESHTITEDARSSDCSLRINAAVAVVP
jgi:hypothetical protein